MNYKGSLPLLILQCLHQGPLHGYAIAQRIKVLSSDILTFKEGTLYPTLHGLENQGAIESFSETVSGRERKCYRLTEQGKKQLHKEQQEWQTFVQAVNGVLGGQA